MLIEYKLLYHFLTQVASDGFTLVTVDLMVYVRRITTRLVTLKSLQTTQVIVYVTMVERLVLLIAAILLLTAAINVQVYRN